MLPLVMLGAGVAAAAQPASQSAAYDPTELAEPSTAVHRDGFVFEASAGFGYVYGSASAGFSQLALAAAGLGVGGFLTRDVALTLRYAGVVFEDPGGDASDGFFIGPSLQIWATDAIWFRGGVGGFLDGKITSDPVHLLGVGIDAAGRLRVLGRRSQRVQRRAGGNVWHRQLDGDRRRVHGRLSISVGTAVVVHSCVMMIRTFVLLSLLVPATALAQAPGDPSQGPPPGYQPPGYQPGYGPPPGYQPGEWRRTGFTFEANIGAGYVHATDNSGNNANSDTTLAGLDIGVGGFLSPSLALTFRIAGVTFTDQNDSSVRIVDEFVGPSVQYWATDNAWLRAGIGLALISALTSDDSTSISEHALGFDFGIGYSLTTHSKHTINFSAEATPGFFSQGTATTFSLLVGYQYL